MTGYRRPRRASLKHVVIAYSAYVVALLLFTAAWNYRDVIWGWFS